MAKKGVKFTEDHKLKISLTLKGKKGTCGMKGKKHSEEARRKIGLAQIGRERKPHSKETRLKMSRSAKGKKMSKEAKLRMSVAKTGNNHPHWKGGISYEEYSVKWTLTLKRSIRERDRYVCQICSKQQYDITFAVHHIDYDKKNCNPDNLITLCKSCHSKTNYNRNYWINILKRN